MIFKKKGEERGREMLVFSNARDIVTHEVSSYSCELSSPYMHRLHFETEALLLCYNGAKMPVSVVNLTQPSHLEERTSIDKLPLLDWLVHASMGHFLYC